MTFEEAMEPLYEYVDRLNDEQRDRLVVGQGWRIGTVGGYQDGAGERCMVGHAAGAVNGKLMDKSAGTTVVRPGAAGAFDSAAERFGIPSVVAAIKARAGARIEIPTETPTPAEVAP
jgi:hypothetical protein